MCFAPPPPPRGQTPPDTHPSCTVRPTEQTPPGDAPAVPSPPLARVTRRDGLWHLSCIRRALRASPARRPSSRMGCPVAPSSGWRAHSPHAVMKGGTRGTCVSEAQHRSASGADPQAGLAGPVGDGGERFEVGARSTVRCAWGGADSSSEQCSRGRSGGRLEFARTAWIEKKSLRQALTRRL